MKTIKKSWAMPLLALSFVLTLAGPFPTAADPIIYATAAAGGKLVRIDVGARQVTEIGNTGVPFALGIAINAQGQAFTVTDSHPAFPGTPRLARVDLATGAATPFGPVLGEEEFMGLGFAPDGTLYGVNATSGTPDAGSLYRFNPATGEATKVGVTGGCFEIMDLAWHPDGTMYGAVNDSLYRVNPTTGQATLVTKLQGLSAVMGLAIDDAGNFYVSEIVTNAPLVRADPVTGATTKLFDTGVDLIHGLDLAPRAQASPPQPITIGFWKGIQGPCPMSGFVDTDLDEDYDDGTICYTSFPELGFVTYEVKTANFSFIARMNIDIDRNHNTVVGYGVITNGWHKGGMVYLDAEVLYDPFRGKGTLQITPPITIGFEKTVRPPCAMSGTVDTDLDGAFDDGTLCYTAVAGSRRVAGDLVHLDADYSVVTSDYAFTARLAVVIDQRQNSVQGTGVISAGWLRGALVSLEAELIPDPFGAKGTLRITPPLTIGFEKTVRPPCAMSGTVDTDLDGAFDDGTICYTSFPELGFDTYEIKTANYSFIARMKIDIDLEKNTVAGSGIIADGWLKGSPAFLEAEVIPEPFGGKGVFRITRPLPIAGPIIYATAGAGKSLVKIDVGAQKVTTLGDFGVPGADAIAINAQGQAFTVTHGWPPGGDSQLARVDLATGQATPFGTPNKPENFMGLGFAPDGTLYGVNAGSGTEDAGSLYRFDPVTGAASKVGVAGGCTNIMDLAWAPDGTMYGADNDSLYRVDAATGQATLVTKLQGLSRVMGLAIDDLGNFYVSEIVTNAPLVRVDPVTGATTKLFDTGVDLIHGLAIRPVPKPIIYATAGAGKSLVKIDVGTRKVTPLGDFGVPGADAIAINAQGQAFTVTHGWPPGGDSQLARVDLATGQATPFGTPNKPENFMGLGFAPDGTLYGVNAGSGTADAGSLYRFDRATGAATKVGVTGGCFAIMDLAWAPDGTMYGAVNDSLYRVDAATGQATLVTKLQGLSRVMGLAIDDYGNFYVSEIVTNAPLVRVDPVTGATTKILETGVDLIHGLDLAPAPQLTAALVSGQIVLSWPAGAAGFVPQATEALGGSPAWVEWPSAPTVVGNRHTLAVEVAAPARFFRLIRR